MFERAIRSKHGEHYIGAELLSKHVARCPCDPHHTVLHWAADDVTHIVCAMTNYATPDLVAQLIEQLNELEKRVEVLENNSSSRPRNTKYREEIVDLLNRFPAATRWTRQAVAIQLGIDETGNSEYQTIVRRLAELEQEGQIEIVNGNTSRPIYQLSEG